MISLSAEIYLKPDPQPRKTSAATVLYVASVHSFILKDFAINKYYSVIGFDNLYKLIVPS